MLKTILKNIALYTLVPVVAAGIVGFLIGARRERNRLEAPQASDKKVA